MTWLLAFVITVAVEALVVALLAPATVRSRAVVDSAAANLCTHPLAWWLVTQGQLGWWPTEALVCLAETVIYARVTRLPWPRAAGLALAANAVTAALSFVF